MSTTITPIEYNPDTIADQVRGRRVLLFGEPGTGKTTLTERIARSLTSKGETLHCICADPGLPAWSPPGTIALARWSGGTWQSLSIEALCSLDAARFRLPLLSAVQKLVGKIGAGGLIIDTPGVVRGVAGAELLSALIECADIDLVVTLTRPNHPLPLADELCSLSKALLLVTCADTAQHPGKKYRKSERTRQWNQWLERSNEISLDFHQCQCLGTPPPKALASVWTGRQVALIHNYTTCYIGEVISLCENQLKARVIAVNNSNIKPEHCSLLVRDAGRNSDSLLVTRHPPEDALLPSQSTLSQPPLLHRYRRGSTGLSVRIPFVEFTLVNGVVGDPLLKIQLLNGRRCLLFDLGDAGRLRSRILHRVTDIFISHTHMDHIFGFPLLLRSRMNSTDPCRIYGPGGLSENLFCQLQGYHWDRIGDDGPQFEVAELTGDTLQWFRLQAGKPVKERLHQQTIEEGLLLCDQHFAVRAIELDHGIPVLAFRFEGQPLVQILKEKVNQAGLATGRWLGELRESILRGDYQQQITLPTGVSSSVEALAHQYTRCEPGEHVVYATDLADSADNRRKLIKFSTAAHTLICEAPFMLKDRQQATDTQHLTTKACAEIALAAGVKQLLPFHFSSRYESSENAVYAELKSFYPRLVC